MKRNPTPRNARSRKNQSLNLIDTKIAGLEFNVRTREERVRLYLSLKKGLRLEVRREPKNQHDKNACAVHVGKMRIGYIPRETAAKLAPKLDQGAKFLFFVSGFRVEFSSFESNADIYVLGIDLGEV